MTAPVEDVKPVRTCGTCQWFADDVGVCVNGDSRYCADFRDEEDICPEWENYDLEMWGRSIF